MTFKHRPESGGSLVEVLVALSLLLVGTVAYFQLDTKLITTNTLSLQRLQAGFLLNHEMQRLTQSPYSNTSGQKTYIRSKINYVVNWSIQTNSGIKRIDVTINWLGHRRHSNEETKLELTGYYPAYASLELNHLLPTGTLLP